MLKSLVLFDQEDTQTHYRIDEFICGDKILVCPINEPNATGRRMYIPRGEWYNKWSKEVVTGGKETWVDADLHHMPIFIKAGAVIPKYPVQQYVGEKEITEMTLDVYFKDGKEESDLFEDANDGYDYTKGRYSLRHFKVVGTDNKLTLRQHKQGKYVTTYETFKINLYGLPFDVNSIKIDNEEVSLEDVQFKNRTLIVSKAFTNIQIIG